MGFLSKSAFVGVRSGEKRIVLMIRVFKWVFLRASEREISFLKWVTSGAWLDPLIEIRETRFLTQASSGAYVIAQKERLQ